MLTLTALSLLLGGTVLLGPIGPARAAAAVDPTFSFAVLPDTQRETRSPVTGGSRTARPGW